jgi:hypothetical protein
MLAAASWRRRPSGLVLVRSTVWRPLLPGMWSGRRERGNVPFTAHRLPAAPPQPQHRPPPACACRLSWAAAWGGPSPSPRRRSSCPAGWPGCCPAASCGPSAAATQSSTRCRTLSRGTGAEYRLLHTQQGCPAAPHLLRLHAAYRRAQHVREARKVGPQVRVELARQPQHVLRAHKPRRTPP